MILSVTERDELGREFRQAWLNYHEQNSPEFHSEFIKSWEELDENDREANRVAAEGAFTAGYKRGLQTPTAA